MRVTVTVPATSANLGPGFDVFGLALDLCNEVTVDTEAAPGVTWEGEGSDELPTDGSDMVCTTVAKIANQMGVQPPAFALHGVHAIPLERGLGSSSAATVAGVLGASLLLGLGWERDPWSVFAAAAEIEGHPDNAAPAVFGGFTIATPDGFVRRLDPHAGIRPAVIVPPSRVATAQARAALPAEISRADAVANIAYAALAVEAFASDPGLLARALQDRLHQDVRVALAGVEDIVDALEGAGIPWCVSGAGPSLLAFEHEGAPPVTPALLGVSDAWHIIRPGVRAVGFEVNLLDG